MSTTEAVIIDTGVANLASVIASLRRCDLDVIVSTDLKTVERADFVVLPGVGAFAAGMDRLHRTGLADPIQDRIRSGGATLAICLGMQLLCRSSEESPGVEGLGIIDATVGSFPAGTRRPQFGWNRVTPASGSSLLTGGYAYYANSYRLSTAPEGWAIATSEHGGRFVAAMERGRVLACQFHPELSGEWGQSILRSWFTRCEEGAPC